MPSGSLRTDRRRWLWLCLPLLGLAELGAQLHAASRAPDEAAWGELEAALAPLHQPGDLLVVAPAWAEPNARAALPERYLPLKHLGRPDEAGFARAIEVSTLGAESPLLAGWPVEQSVEQGPFLLRVRSNPGYRPVRFDFVDHVDPQHAQAFGGPERHPCPFLKNAHVNSGDLGGGPTFPAQRFSCRGSEWFFVGVTVIDDSNEYRPRRCIWAHPTLDGAISVRFRAVPLGQTIRGYGSLPWLLERTWDGAPVTLTVRVGAEELGRMLHRDGDGWKHFEFPLGKHANTTANVEFEVTTADATDRHFCFQADSR